MAIRPYTGTARPVSDAYEGKSGFRVVESDEADGSISRGYQRVSDGQLLSMACMVVSASRQAALDAAAAAEVARSVQIANFKQSIVDLATKVKNNTATAAEQRQLLTKLSRAVLGLLSDL